MMGENLTLNQSSTSIGLYESRETRFSTLRLENVGRRFGGTQALAEFDLEVTGGEFVALLGPSGCGKSTALNCLAGLLPLTSGSIELDGERIDTLPPEKRDFGMVFQNYALFPHLTVMKNVAFGLTMRRMPKREISERSREALSLVKLDDQTDKLPGQLSGGQQQRVAIARAVAMQPRLVLMDEPLSNLDAKLRIEMRGEIRRLHQLLGLTTIYVTHDQEEALSMADRLVVMREGRIQQIDSPEGVYSRPLNPYVAEFMGYRNQLDGVALSSSREGMVEVEVANTKMVAKAMSRIVKGDAVRIAIRPDEMSPVSEHSAGSDRNHMSARTLVVEYQGTSVAVQMEGLGDQRLFMRTSDKVPPVGGDVALSVPRSRTLAYPSQLR